MNFETRPTRGSRTRQTSLHDGKRTTFRRIFFNTSSTRIQGSSFFQLGVLSFFVFLPRRRRSGGQRFEQGSHGKVDEYRKPDALLCTSGGRDAVATFFLQVAQSEPGECRLITVASVARENGPSFRPSSKSNESCQRFVPVSG